jgi:hypothetical protein
MPRSGYLAYITPVERPGFGGGGGGDPDYGVDEGAGPDQGLPGFPGSPGHPGHLPARPGRPVDPGFGQGRPPRPGHLPSRPGRPTDPDYGVGEEQPGQLPVWPIGPDQGLPPIAGHPLPPTDPPPGTVWPPLPPGAAPTGKALVLAAIQGVGYRYIVIQISPPAPDQGLPPEEGGEHPDQELPQPPTPQPKSRLGR